MLFRLSGSRLYSRIAESLSGVYLFPLQIMPHLVTNFLRSLKQIVTSSADFRVTQFQFSIVLGAQYLSPESTYCPFTKEQNEQVMRLPNHMVCCDCFVSTVLLALNSLSVLTRVTLFCSLKGKKRDMLPLLSNSAIP